MKHLLPGLFLFCCSALFSQAPTVENVRFEQRTDGSLLVDIYYDLTAAGGIWPDITIEASDDNGETWDLNCESLNGDIGKEIPPGEGKQIVWDFYADHPDQKGENYRFRITANQDICGKTITEDFTITEDMDCNIVGGNAITIGADDITLDLGGHTISGDRPYLGCCIFNQSYNRNTIRNGIIENGYDHGIDISGNDSCLIEDMILRDLVSFNPDTFIMGIVTGSSNGLIIRDCQFEYLYEFHREAVGIYGSSVEIDNIEITGGAVGVDIVGNRADGMVTVENSRFNVFLAGVLVHKTTNARIAHNIFEGGGGVSVEPYLTGVISGLVIEENEISNATEGNGIGLRGGTFVTVRNNTIQNNARGIFLSRSIECDHHGEDFEHCFYATGNIIENNIVLGNEIDLEHCDLCTGNTWTGNTYETARGMEIYQYGPSTARSGLADLDSVAGSVFSDAELIDLFSGSADTAGEAYTWIYHYRSTGQQKAYELWYQDGRALLRDSVDYTQFEGMMPLHETWIDSDSAVAVTDEMGGREFRNEFDLETIEMGLGYSGSLLWTVRFIAADTGFCVEFDASLK